MDEWLQLLRSIERQIECGCDRDADTALSLHRAITPYGDDWKQRYKTWQLENESK